MLRDSEVIQLKSRLKEEFSDYTEIAGGKNYRYTHLKAVHRIVKKLAEEASEEVDERVLEIAALFHDIGRKEDIEDGEMDPSEGHESHDQRGADIVHDYVEDFVSEGEISKIEDIIRNHHSEAETVEGEILQDADKISNFGVGNLWRQIHYSAQHGRTLEESIEYFWNTAIEEFENQIREMHFDKSKKIAERRLEKHKEAVKQIEKEVEAEDF